MTADLTSDRPENRAAYPFRSVVDDSGKTLLSQGIEYVRSRQFDQAIALFDQSILHAANQHQSDLLAKSAYHRGCALCRIDKYQAAITDFTYLLAPDTSSQWAIEKRALIYVQRGNTYRRLGHHTQAIADLNQAVQLSGGSAQSYGCRGLLRSDAGDFEGAIADFNQALTLHPTFAQGYLWRGFAQLNNQRPEAAIADLTRAIEAIPTCAEAYNHRGLAYFYLSEFDAALADFNQAIRLDGQFAEAYNNRGCLLQLLGDTTAALIDHDRSIKLNSKLAEQYLNRAALTSLGENTTDALADYSKVAGLETNSAAFYRRRSQIYVHEGDFKSAIADLSTAISLIPTANAHYQRGIAYLTLKQNSLALQDFDQAIALSPDFGSPYAERARLHFNNNNPQQALNDANQAIALLPQSSPQYREATITRCLSHFLLGDTPQSRLRHRHQAQTDIEQLTAYFESQANQTPKGSNCESICAAADADSFCDS